VNLSDFDYELPERFIAQTPAEPRDTAKLLVYRRAGGEIFDRKFCDILEYLRAGDLIVLNTTKVRKARIFGQKEGENGAKIEIFLLKEIEKREYEVLLKPGRKVRVGDRISVGGNLAGGVAAGRVIIGECVSKDSALGTARMKFDGNVEGVGEVPLPPYIKSGAAENCGAEKQYQTVYARELGSCAAPTAGLHWTPELILRAKNMGVRFAEVLLHVGLGTFRPVKVEKVEEHKMHSEFYSVSATAAAEINLAKSEGRRVICCGTTSVRTVESVWARFGEMRECAGETEIFIYPPYDFKVCDGLITNFHLPKSTLLMLVCAFMKEWRKVYEHAKSLEYRFFSFGDACFFC
jgi:S-adenosylmethionine:tRNA ribosyltransferase-isomerase